MVYTFRRCSSTLLLLDVILMEVEEILTMLVNLTEVLQWSAVADPGFPRGGGTNSPGGAKIRFC